MMKKQEVKKSAQTMENESGRSMVEMLGVLAIMGLLSIGGIIGYRWGMDMYYANLTIKEMNQRAVVYSQQLIAGNKEISSKEFNPENATSLGYPLIANAIENQPYFRVELSAVPKRVCQNIVNADWFLPFAMYVNGRPDYGSGIECPIKENKMAFYFHLDLTEENGESSDTGTGSGRWYPEESYVFICRNNNYCGRLEPVCDTDTGKCGPCTNNDDCSRYTSYPVCNVETGACEKCETNADCFRYVDYPTCNMETGSCQKCTINGDCNGHPAGNLCNTRTGKCGECLTDDDCIGNPSGEICHQQEGICVKCRVDKDCSQEDPKEICDQVLHSCTPKPTVQIKDKDGNMHDCESSRLILVPDNAECDKCPNRLMQFGYCAPVCRDGEWLQRDEDAKQPITRCLKCTQQTGWHYGTQTPEFCNVCPERYYFADSWGAEHMCALKDCGTGYFQCNNGCCSCSGNDNHIGIGTGSHGYDENNNYGLWQGYTYNGYKSCLACAEVGYRREVKGRSCVLITQ